MTLRIVTARYDFRPDRTIGQLLLNGLQFGYVLEDACREILGKPVESWKVAGETAIPVGVYAVSIYNFPTRGPTIVLNNVPGYTGILAHGGNTPKDTEGCQIVGHRIAVDLDHVPSIAPGYSGSCLDLLNLNVSAAIRRGEPVFWHIQGLPGNLSAGA